jgi:hypothetical protein
LPAKNSNNGLIKKSNLTPNLPEINPVKNELLLGCGHARDKRIFDKSEGKEWHNMVSLDNNPNVKPDLLCDLSQAHIDAEGNFSWSWLACALNNFGEQALSDQASPDREGYFYLKENFFHEVHAYEVLEHLGVQGQQESFFGTFSNLYRILVPDGMVLATVPSRFSGNLWGDPGHRRAIVAETLYFLNQANYTQQCDPWIKNPTERGPDHTGTAMSDYRNIWKGDFEVVQQNDDKKNGTFTFALRAIKPSRISV